MSDPSQAIRAYIVGSFTQLPPSLIDDLSNGSITLLSIVRLLGEYLTSEDEQARTRAVQLLSEITCHFLDTPASSSLATIASSSSSSASTLPTAHLSDIFTVQAIRTLTSFFAEKISDGVIISDNFIRSSKAPEILPDTAPRARKNEAEQKTLQGSAMLVSALKALIVLSTCKSSTPAELQAAEASAPTTQPPLPPPAKGFGQEQAHAVTDALFSHVKPTDHPQSLRYIIYRLLDSLVAHHRNSLKSFKSSTAPSSSTVSASEPTHIETGQEDNAAESAPMDVDELPAEARSEHCEGKPFLQGYAIMVQGEKDPRNLMVLFGVDKVLLTEWTMDREMTEKFFDITFCYFPITFRPPPDDPYGITSEDLKVALRAAICASPSMASLGYPLLLEKLSAAGGPAKLDTLKTLIAALPVYGRAAAVANAKKLWEALKIEIFHATDDETGDLSCDTLTTFLHVLYNGVDPPEGIAPKIVHDCLVELEEPGKSLAKTATNALLCLIRATPSTAYLAVYGFMDQMLKLFADPEDLTQRIPILGSIGQVLDSLAKVYRHAARKRLEQVQAGTQTISTKGAGGSALGVVASKTPEEEEIGSGRLLPPSTASQRSYNNDNRPLDAFLSDLLSCLSNGLRSTSYRRSAMLVFSSAVSISILSSSTPIPNKTSSNSGEDKDGKTNNPFLTFEELSYLTREVASLLVSPVGDEIREEALCAVEVISNESSSTSATPLGATNNPTIRVVEEVVLPVLLEKLPDRITVSQSDQIDSQGPQPTADLERTKSNIRRSLGALSRLCVSPVLFEMVVVKLFTKLELCCRTAPSALSASASSNSTDERDAASVEEIHDANLGYARGLVLTLQTMVDLKKAQRHKDLLKYAQTLPTRLVKLTSTALEGLLLEEGDSSSSGNANGDSKATRSAFGIGAHPSLISDSAGLLSSLVKLLDPVKQRELLLILNNTFARGQTPLYLASKGVDSTEPISSGNSLIPASSPLAKLFAPFESSSFPAGTQHEALKQASQNSVALFAACMISSSPLAGIPVLAAPAGEDDTQNTDKATLRLLSLLIDWTIESSHTFSSLQKSAEFDKLSSTLQTNSGLWMISSVVNKFVTNEMSNEAFQDILDQFWKHHVVSFGETSDVGIQIWLWITRALVIRSSDLSRAMLGRVLQEVFDPIVSSSSGNGLTATAEEHGKRERMRWNLAKKSARYLAQIVAINDSPITNKENGFTVRLLWKQKFFDWILPKLLDGYQTYQRPTSHSHSHSHAGHDHHHHHGEGGDGCGHSHATVDSGTIYLISITSLLPHLPSSVLVDQLGKLFPLLITALDLPDSSARKAASNAIFVANELEKRISSSSSTSGKTEANVVGGSRDEKANSSASLFANGGKGMIHQYLDEILTRLSTNVVPSSHATANVRISALRTLTSLATDPPESLVRDLLRYKPKLLRLLAQPYQGIDDKNRKVRLFAVDARDTWFNLQAQS